MKCLPIIYCQKINGVGQINKMDPERERRVWFFLKFYPISPKRREIGCTLLHFEVAGIKTKEEVRIIGRFHVTNLSLDFFSLSLSLFWWSERQKYFLSFFIKGTPQKESINHAALTYIQQIQIWRIRLSLT